MSRPATLRSNLLQPAPVGGGPPAPGLTAKAPAAVEPGERLGILFPLSLVWLLFEFGRPYTPPGLPLLITGALFVHWLGKKDKQWSRQSPMWFGLLAVVGIGGFFAANTYAVYFSLRLLATTFLGVCLPLQAMVTSVRRLRLWLYAFILVAVYVGAWATTHGGFGPAGSDGQDENYVATLMDMGIAFAYFVLLAEKRLALKVLLGASMAVFVAAMALASNPSRGGFLGLCAVGAYCLARSPKKKRMMGIGAIAFAGLVLLAVAGSGFWSEIETTTDYESGTGDTRIEVWKAGLRMWEGNPIFGVGAGNLRWVIGDYQTADQFEKFGRSLGGSIVAHSMHVEMLAELGTIGVLVVATLVWATWTGLGRVRARMPRPGEPPVHPDLAELGYYADALRAGILAVLVTGAFLSLFYYSHLWVLLGVGGALPFVYRRIKRTHGSEGAVPAGASHPVPRGGLRASTLPGHPARPGRRS